MKCFWIYLYIYICTHIYSLCVYVKNPHTNTAVLHWLFHFSVKDTRFQSLKSRTKVTAEDRGLAWCTFPCEGPSLLDSGSLQCMAYCMDRSHSSCHRSWHILDHRYRTQPRAYIGWLHNSAEAPSGHWCPLSDRPGYMPGMTHSNSFYGLDIHTCLSRRTGRKSHNPQLSGRSETPRIWVSGILDELGALPSLSLDTVQALVFSEVCCRTHWTLLSRIQQSHPHQTWSFHLHQLNHHAYVHYSCHKDHRACPWDGGQPWLQQNCLHPRIFPNLL